MAGRLNITRDQLARFIGQDARAIKQFENLFGVVNEITTDTLIDILIQAGNAMTAANEALARLEALADTLEKEPHDPSAAAVQALADMLDKQPPLTDLTPGLIQDLAVAPPPQSQTKIIAGTGLSGGGYNSQDVDLALADTVVTPGSYRSANITVDQQGRLTAAANGGYTLVDQAGAPITSGPTWTYSSNVPTIALTGLATYSEFILVVRSMGASASDQRNIVLSADNGSTYYTTSGDYQVIGENGVEAASSVAMSLHGTATTAGRAGMVRISTAQGAYATIESLNRSSTVTVNRILAATTNKVNAIRVQNGVVNGDITSGSLWLFAR